MLNPLISKKGHLHSVSGPFELSVCHNIKPIHFPSENIIQYPPLQDLIYFGVAISCLPHKRIRDYWGDDFISCRSLKWYISRRCFVKQHHSNYRLKTLLQHLSCFPVGFLWVKLLIYTSENTERSLKTLQLSFFSVKYFWPKNTYSEFW